MRSLSTLQTLSLFVSNLRQGVYITNASGRILDANPAFLEMFGAHSLEQLQAHTADTLLVDPSRRLEEMQLLQETGAVREYELEIRRLDGQVRSVLDTAYQVVDTTAGELLYHGILMDITDRKDLERQLREASVRDPLTGCHNRRFLQDKAATLESTNTSWGIIVADIDHFKDYNDRYGHDVGDRLLVQVGRFLTTAVRADDPVIRTGGDEFAVLLPGAGLESTRQVASRLQAAGPVSAPVSFTLGWAARQDDERVEDTIRRADHHLIRVRVETRHPRGAR
jgi:diguanylate cyclase (GGDEF)-like protein/PAS domain S-box-containing protein